MSNLVPIQSIYCSNEDETKLCSFDIEVLSQPATPLIHPMSRLWLINEGDTSFKQQTLSFGKRYACFRTPMADYRDYRSSVLSAVLCHGLLF